MQASDGNFFGFANGYNMFRLTPGGLYTLAHSFCASASSACGEGTQLSSLVQGSTGLLYGTDSYGGTHGNGFLFDISGVGGKTQNPDIGLDATPLPPSVGQTVTVHLSVTGATATPTGTVRLSVNGTQLCYVQLSSTAAAECSIGTAAYPAGDYPVEIEYSGDANYATVATTTGVTLEPAPTEVRLGISPSSVSPPAPVTFSVSVSNQDSVPLEAPSGAVTLFYGSYEIGTATVSDGLGQVTLATGGVPPGTYAITARYDGNAQEAVSTSATVNLEIQ